MGAVDPAPPLPVRVVLCLALLLATAAAASWFAWVDIVAPASGEIVARDRTRAVHALETGVVRALHVDEGLRVRAGTLLVELDDTIVGSEIRRIEADLREARHTARRLRLLREEIRTAAAEGTSRGRRAGGHPAQEPGGEGWGRHLRLADLERRRLASALAEADRRVESGRLRRGAVEAERRLVDRLLPVVREQEDGLAALAARSHASRHDYLGELSRRIDLEGRADSLAADARREAAEIARLEASARLLRLERAVAWQRELLAAEIEGVRLAEDLVQARRRRLRHRVVAPLDGVVQDVGELAAGSFVRQGDRLMAVVPAGGGLEIRAHVRNRDIGFVRVGQAAIVKIDAFPFTRYGTTEGVVEGVSLDAVDDLGSGGAEEAADAIGAGYLARIALTRPTLEIDGVPVPLRPGMRAAVDIRTGRRRIIEYVFAPLVAYGSNAFRER